MSFFIYVEEKFARMKKWNGWMRIWASIEIALVINLLQKSYSKKFLSSQTPFSQKKSPSGIGIFRIDWDFLLPYHNTMEVLKNRFLPYICFFFQEKRRSLMILFQLILENLYHLDSDSHYLILLMTRIILRTKKLFTKT